MNKFFCKSIALIVLLVNSLFVFSQTKIMIYNNNTTQRESKIFTANLLQSFTIPKFECEASDETPNINYLLKKQGYKTRNNVLTDSLIETVCEKFEVDYLITFILYPQKTTKNVTVNLINANTFSVEKTKTVTCNNLNNKTQIKKTTDEIAAFFLLEDLNIKPDSPAYAENVIVEPNKKDKQGNLNGHYLSLGSSLFSSGYYGGLGLAYEYRYWIFGVNASIGTSIYYGGPIVNVGCKVYLANKIPFLKNLYFNINPFCYFGQGVELISSHYEAGDDYNIIMTSVYKYSPVFGGRVFFGYSPVWRVGKKISLGFNMNIGIDIGYQTNYKLRHRYSYPLFPVNWDLGFIIKLD